MIKVYCVGIHFRHEIQFKADLNSEGLKSPPFVYMSGEAILAAAAKKFGLRYKLAPIDPAVPDPLYPQRGHVEFLSYTPTVEQDPHPRITFGSNFPFYGLPLSLIEHLAPIGEISSVIQYTVAAAKPFENPTPKPLHNTGQAVPNSADSFLKTGDSAFGSNGFLDNTEIRLRLLSIYCTS